MAGYTVASLDVLDLPSGAIILARVLGRKAAMRFLWCWNGGTIILDLEVI